ncbi:hypothetical protein AC578_2629 [Pseudocercospora eumusae]|uniref:Ran-interacting Mog1 protein n=1 Tax=Pseudocercospora eumusae TaxID=321146 RepID=A0A139H0B8_9PEZI|nr:hypothetical protein AC578_2629 [Pseudocercospora eumusae]
MTSEKFKTIELFGGAIIAEIPATFTDVSKIRQVPDNQEVYLDTEGFSSIVFEILERVEIEKGNDDDDDVEALKYHLSDIVDEDAGHTILYNTGSAYLSKMPNTTAVTLLATSPPGEKQRGRPNEPDFVGILLILVRLEEQKTDIVIAINVPHLPGSYVKEDVDPAAGKYGNLLEAGKVVKEKVLESFEIKDWGLFVQED